MNFCLLFLEFDRMLIPVYWNDLDDIGSIEAMDLMNNYDFSQCNLDWTFRGEYRNVAMR